MNRALRESRNIDSDGDGIPNFFDPFPLTPDVSFSIQGVQLNGSKPGVSFAFGGKANAQYVIEYATNLNAPKWQVLSGSLQSGSSNGMINFTDQIAAGAPQRYYRVRLIQ
jgi:hypothetical protein